MIKHILQQLYTQNKVKILLVLILSSLFSLMLIAFRIYYSTSITFLFLVWNLFLAWIPYWIGLTLILFSDKIKSKLLITLLLFTWLLFFPNAPYILTDLFHFNQKAGVPIWFDLIMILSFVWNGLLLGFLSLMDVQLFITRKTNTLTGWLFALFSLILGSFGIYLGRYLRWNSWDILSNPLLLFYDIGDRILHPSLHYRTFGVTLLFSAFLILIYLTLKFMVNESNTQKS